MNKLSNLGQTDVGLTLEHPEKKFTIRSANLALEQAHLQGQPEDVAIALIRLHNTAQSAQQNGVKRTVKRSNPHTVPA